MLRLCFRLIRAINSETSPERISLALCLGLTAGLLPFLSPINLIVLFLLFILRVNISAFIIGTLFFSAVAYFFDPLFHIIGKAILTLGPLEALWTYFYNITIFRLSNFNNTIVMGSLFTAIVLFIPAFLIFNRLIRSYRESVLAYFTQLRVVRVVTNSNLYRAYSAFRGARG
ncbi:hypothetical protein MNBD_DELTA01-587 [hydrothermal vent metagenome]|uniref:DUF2062 domain-containing protein n=1 Tax=hydrothermal vent metagenome TaxID=652676 RepID=A0A3B0QR19_9ZZZZ